MLCFELFTTHPNHPQRFSKAANNYSKSHPNIPTQAFMISRFHGIIVSRLCAIDLLGGILVKPTQNMTIDKIVRNVTATLAIEGLKPSKAAVAINQQFLEGKISSSEAINKIKSNYSSFLVK